MPFRSFLPLLALLLLIPPGAPQASDRDARDSYVTSNLLAALYHGLGHALIDTMDLAPGYEVERRASVLTVLMIDRFYEERAAADMALDTAFGFSERYEARGQAQRPSPYWRAHGTGLERYYDLLCLFAGGNLVERSDLVLSLGLFSSRLPGCPDEFIAAMAEWSPVLTKLEDLLAQGRGHPLSFAIEAPIDAALEDILRSELQALNATMHLPDPLRVAVAPCRTADVQWHGTLREITICSEYISYLRETADHP